MRCVPLVIASLLAATVAHAEQPSVAIVVLGEVNLDRAESSKIGDRLGDALQGEFQARSIPATTMTAVASEVPQSCMQDLACTSELAAKVRASYVLFVSVVKIGGSVRMEGTWANPGRGFQLGKGVTLSKEPSGADYRKAIRSLVPPGFLSPRAKPGRHMTPAVWAFGGAALALAGGSVGFALWANDRAGDCASGCPDEVFDQIDEDVSRRALVADIAGGLALASGVAAVIFYLRSDSSGDTGAERASISVGPSSSGLGLAIGGRF